MQNEKAAGIIAKIRYASISTVDENGNPWSAPVWYVSDGEHLFWWSSQHSQHQRNIARTGRAFITIFDSTAPEGEGLGVYIDAEVEVVAPEQLQSAMDLYNNTTTFYKLSTENCTGDAPTRLYQATPRTIWLNDGTYESGSYEDIRIAVE